MREIEEQLAGAGKKAVKRKDKKSPPKPSATQDLESSPTTLVLGERLRQWSQDHDWYQLGYIKNHLALKRAFSKPICAAVSDFLTQGHSNLGFQIKTDFDTLLDMVKRFDVRCREGCAEEDELIACEHLQEHIHTAIDDLAALLDNRDLSGDVPLAEQPHPDKLTAVATAAGHELWVTFGQAVEILAVSKPTLTRWVTEGKLTCNGQTGRSRKLSKISVLFRKQAIEDMDRMEDAKEIRLDEKRLDTLHKR